MSKQILLDTNILVYSKDEASLYFSSVCQALEGLVESDVTLCVNKQILREYACVATRPAPKGLNADTDQVLNVINLSGYCCFFRSLLPLGRRLG